VKAMHVLVPQIERGLRGIVAKLGKPVTKAHSTVAGVGVAIGMGDILYSEELSLALGPDLSLYFLALYADSRRMNLCNRMAHGLIKPEAIDENLVRFLIHTLLVFGVWRKWLKGGGRDKTCNVVPHGGHRIARNRKSCPSVLARWRESTSNMVSAISVPLLRLE
jgi:hypothetical protein